MICHRHHVSGVAQTRKVHEDLRRRALLPEEHVSFDSPT